MDIKADIAVCGRFHYHKYLKFLNKLKILNCFFCSYKRNHHFGVEPKYIKNYFLKEYLMYFNIRVLGGWNLKKNILLYHKIWERQVLSNSIKSDLLHIMIHGNGLEIIKKYKSQGKPVIGEAVNAHPQKQYDLLQAEYANYNLTYPKQYSEKMMEEFQLCDYILVASQFVKKSFLDNGFDEKKIICIPYGTDNFLQSNKVHSSEIFKIVCVGQITFRKGQKYLLEAINSLKSKGHKIHLTLVGFLDPAYKTFLNLDGHTHLPHIENNSIIEFLKDFNLFVLPSIEDGFSVAVTEALAAGLPVVTTNTNGSCDLIEDFNNGFIVNPYSANEIEQAIIKSLGHNFSFSKKPSSWEAYAFNLSQQYQKILAA